MAGDWIKMRADLHTHPKVVRMASALKADRLRIVGGLHSAWCLFDSRWTPSLEDWEPYKKSQIEREQKNQEEMLRGQEIRGFKDKHRAIDEQYRRFHDDRVNRFKNYFSWSND